MRIIQFAASEIGIEATTRNASTTRITMRMLANKNQLLILSLAGANPSEVTFP